jgi:hypothetical protein
VKALSQTQKVTQLNNPQLLFKQFYLGITTPIILHVEWAPSQVPPVLQFIALFERIINVTETQHFIIYVFL